MGCLFIVHPLALGLDSSILPFLVSIHQALGDGWEVSFSTILFGCHGGLDFRRQGRRSAMEYDLDKRNHLPSNEPHCTVVNGG